MKVVNLENEFKFGKNKTWKIILKSSEDYGVCYLTQYFLNI
tara:strand:+ start:13 stop:135 length:123 start_codon:yes stop_codon:yes gene_type:complete